VNIKSPHIPTSFGSENIGEVNKALTVGKPTTACMVDIASFASIRQHPYMLSFFLTLFEGYLHLGVAVANRVNHRPHYNGVKTLGADRAASHPVPSHAKACHARAPLASAVHGGSHGEIWARRGSSFSLPAAAPTSNSSGQGARPQISQV
jgi:hypothetical protein